MGVLTKVFRIGSFKKIIQKKDLHACAKNIQISYVFLKVCRVSHNAKEC